ncbi:MAG: hypothetical protein KBD78_16040 [Oligoflexales bacterium]|nr:hypothetical protein [Oligoflexales bacterium]
MDKRKNRTHNHHPERITLSPVSLESVSRWTEQMKSELRGSKFTRNDMVNWIIGQRGVELSKGEVEEIRRLYFDPKKALGWALAQLKEAHKSGQDIDVNKLVQETLITKKVVKKASIKSKPKGQLDLEIGNSDH